MENELSKKDQEIGSLKTQIEIMKKLKLIGYVNEEQLQKLIELVALSNL